MAEAITLHIEGMTCTSCAEHVQQALTNVPGVRAASVSYPQRQAEIDSLREYAGHGFKYGGSASQINKMSMKAKQAEKLERQHAEHAEQLAALQEDIELPINIASGGELDGFVVQLVKPNSEPTIGQLSG